jgi:non-specific serine/threonine protein kinase
MFLYFTEKGYRVENGTLSYEQLYHLAFDGTRPEEPGLRFLADIAKLLANNVRRDPDLELTRTAKVLDPQDGLFLLGELPYVLGAEFVNLHWIETIYNELRNVCNTELAAFQGTAAEYFQSQNTALTISGRVFFHLVESKEEDYPFAFMATYSTKLEGVVRHLPLKQALKEFDADQSALLSLLKAVSSAANESVFISDLVESGELFSPLKFQAEDAYTFLREVPLYEECGIICRIPDFWKRKTKARLTLSVGSKEPSNLGMDSLLSFSPDVYLGDTILTKEELEELLSADNGLAFLKGKWVEVNQKRIQQILDALAQIEEQGNMTFAQALKMQAGIREAAEPIEDTEVTITNGEWLQTVFTRMTKPELIAPVDPGDGFAADLRPYQQTGVNWLAFMGQTGFGALLADDMGLGKTVQILALLEGHRREGRESKTLLVVPASLLVNWQKETEKFTPHLRICVVHGNNTEVTLEDYDLFVTTYGMVARLEQLSLIIWDILILDEAQAIKNPGIKQTKAVKKLNAKVRIAMTGTPVENRLGDLWSLFDFLDPGLLGSGKEFTAFTKRLKSAPEGYGKLRDTISPFILRRLKTDKSIISDLPDKNEIRQFTTLTKKQIALYQAFVKDMEKQLNEAKTDGIERKGQILAAIMKLKQLCNHPDQFLGQSEFAEKHSGKFETLGKICETIRDKHESVLVFTQFREMTEPLSHYLETVFERPGLVIHGGTTPKKRGQIVEQFNTEYVPFMVLSLKAGGVGLNLTAANHVVHFDRWWNPAIENQATDRAFRIGQTKDVMVHKFITSGTIEEKIDKMIASKEKLAADVIEASTGESWITEMSNEELMNLFRLEG